MGCGFESSIKLDKHALYQAEKEKLTTLFSDVDSTKRLLVEGIIDDAAYLFAENIVLKESLKVTGTVRINPNCPTQQKPVEAAKQFRQNSAAYSVIIKTLNGVLSKNIIPDDDDLKDFDDE